MSNKLPLSDALKRLAANEEKFEGIVNGVEGHEEELGGKKTPSLRTIFAQLTSGAFLSECVQRACACAKHWALQANKIATEDAVIATGSTEARTLPDRFADVVNVKDFGAKGDGVTDDTAAFVSASLVQNVIFVPAGTYKISNIIDALFYGDGVLLINGTYIPAGDISKPVTIPFPGPFDSFASIFQYLSRRNVSATVSIVIHEGIHDITEQITHNLECGHFLRIVGSGSESCTLRFSLPSAQGQAAVNLSGLYAIGLVDNLTLDGNSRYGYSGEGPETSNGDPRDPVGVFATYGAYIKLGPDVIVKDFARNGVFATAGGQIDCANIEVSGTGSDGFVASQNGVLRCSNAKAKACYGVGFYADYSGAIWCNEAVAENIKKRNGVSGTGFMAIYGGSIMADDSQAVGCAGHGYEASYASDLYANFSTVNGCAQSGILSRNNSSVSASNVTISQAGDYAVNCQASSDVLINNAEITGNKAALYVSDSGSVSGDYVSITNNEQGALCTNHSFVELTHATISENTGTAVDVRGNSTVNLSGSVISSNTGIGVYATTGANVNLSNATVSDNTKNGLQFESGSFGNAANVQSLRNANGVRIDSNATVITSGNPQFSGNTEYGLFMIRGGKMYATGLSIASICQNNGTAAYSGTLETGADTANSKVYAQT